MGFRNPVASSYDHRTLSQNDGVGSSEGYEAITRGIGHLFRPGGTGISAEATSFRAAHLGLTNLHRRRKAGVPGKLPRVDLSNQRPQHELRSADGGHGRP